MAKNQGNVEQGSREVRGSSSPLYARVCVYLSKADMLAQIPYRSYVMDYSDPAQRTVFGVQCRNVFETASQIIQTFRK